MIRIAIIDEDFVEKKIAAEDHAGRIVSHGYLCEYVLKCSLQSADIIGVGVTKDGESSNLVEDIPAAFLRAEKLGAKLIVMSIGTTNKLFTREMSDIIDRLTEQGVVFVCSCSNENTITFPAAFPNVIGVRYDITETLEEGEFVFIENPADGVNVVYRTPVTELSYMSSHYERISNSIAAPHFAGWLYKMINENPSKTFCTETVIEILEQHSSPVDLGFDYYCSILEPEKRNDGTMFVTEVFGEKEVSYKAINNLSNFFENDGYCVGIVGSEIPHEPHNYSFSVEKLIGEGLVRQDIVEYLFSLAKIDILFVITGGAAPLEQIISDAYVFVGNGTDNVGCEMRLSADPSCKELENLKDEFVNRFS